MVTNMELKNFCALVSQTNFDGCREMLQALSDNDKIHLVNSEIRRMKTPLHLAADPKVDHGIWELVLPFASEENLYEGFINPLKKLIPYADFEQNREHYNFGIVLKSNQLQKIKCWLAMTKNSTSSKVKLSRNHFLCSLGRCKGSDEQGYASIDDIAELAKDLVDKFSTDPNGYDEDFRPLLWAIETGNLPLVSLLLSHGADANIKDSDGHTPLLYMSSLQGHIDTRLSIVLLLVEYGGHLNTNEAESLVTVFHILLIVLEPEELEVFMRKFPYKVDLTSNCALPLPSLHGMLLHGLSISRYRTDRVMLQRDIIEKAEVLLKYGLQLNTVDIHGRTILHYACWFRYAILVEFLLSKEYEPCRKDAFGRTFVHYAVIYPSANYRIFNAEEELSVLKVLVRALDKNELNVADKYGRRVQYLSLFENNRTAIQYMFSIGFEKGVWDKKGISFADYEPCQRYKREKSTHITNSRRDDGEDKEKTTANLRCVPSTFQDDFTVLYERHPSNSNIQGDYTVLYERVPSNCTYTSAKEPEGTELVATLLHDPNYGPLDMNYYEKNIIEDVTKLVNKISKQLNEMDSRFHSTIELAGSMSEGTKIRPLDEFDFQFHLKVLSPCFYFYDFEKFVEANDVDLKIISTNELNMGDFMHDGKSTSLSLYKRFNSYICSILNSVDFWRDLPFYWCYFTILKPASWVQTTLVAGSLTTPLRLKYIGIGQADLHISIDLVPVIGIARLPPTIQRLIPLKIQSFVNRKNFQWHVICRKSDYARLSFLNVERWILLRLMNEVKDAYKLTKSLRSFCSSASDWNPDIITSYMLKNALFYELDPNVSYGILSSDMVFYHSFRPIQRLAIRMMRKSLHDKIVYRNLYIQSWAWRILDRLEIWFVTKKGARMYCRPDVIFPDVTVYDEYMDNPYLKALQKLKELLFK